MARDQGYGGAVFIHYGYPFEFAARFVVKEAHGKIPVRDFTGNFKGQKVPGIAAAVADKYQRGHRIEIGPERMALNGLIRDGECLRGRVGAVRNSDYHSIKRVARFGNRNIPARRVDYPGRYRDDIARGYFQRRVPGFRRSD